jgi:hypothetical protein
MGPQKILHRTPENYRAGTGLAFAFLFRLLPVYNLKFTNNLHFFLIQSLI